jgi:hypothetical protein
MLYGLHATGKAHSPSHCALTQLNHSSPLEVRASIPMAFARTERLQFIQAVTFGETAVKRIALCFDGTWNKAEQEVSTNVARLSKVIERSEQQLAWYDMGVGTSQWEKLSRSVRLWTEPKYSTGVRVSESDVRAGRPHIYLWLQQRRVYSQESRRLDSQMRHSPPGENAISKTAWA